MYCWKNRLEDLKVAPLIMLSLARTLNTDAGIFGKGILSQSNCVHQHSYRISLLIIAIWPLWHIWCLNEKVNASYFVFAIGLPILGLSVRFCSVSDSRALSYYWFLETNTGAC